MRNSSLLVACLAVASAVSLFAQAKPPVRSVDLSDPAGDVGLIQTSTSEGRDLNFPGFDVVKLSLASDGTQITFAATVNAPPAEVAATVLEIYIDADNSPRTGAAVDYTTFGGFEFRGALEECVALSTSAESCAGASSTPSAKLVRRYAIVRLDQLKGPKESDGRVELMDANGFFAPMRAPQTPIVGSVVQASLPYSALKLTPGRTVRIVMREASTYPTKTGTPQGFFPEVRLTLK